MVGISLPGLDQPGYRAYPLVDHIADKVAAIIEPHGDGRPSTRFRDLIDLTTLVVCVRVTATDQLTALLSEFNRRSLPTPGRFDVPDRGIWTSGFSRAVRKAVNPPARTLDEALALVSPYFNPLLDGTATGTWDPVDAIWR